MPRIIVKCKYIKGAKHRDFYTKYMATREGAEKVNNSFGKADATAKQKEMIKQMLKDFPESKQLFEYEDYIQNPNRENASELISTIMEHNLDQVATKENYVDYIANRPRVEKLGEHGLFSDTDGVINLNETARIVAEHQGVVWTNIISIKREDATRLGYDNANAWMNLCRAKRNELAEAMKIEPNNLKWYAAFHNEGHHPHIHMIVYSEDINQGYLSKKGIEQIRKIYANTIFKQDLYHLYGTKTEQRDEIKKVSQERIKELLDSLDQPLQENDEISHKILELYNRIQNHKGKLVYGFLKKEDKQLVDEVVSLLEKDERIQELYKAWYQTKEDIVQTYKDKLDVRLPLHAQNEFKSIRNMVLNEISKLNFENTNFDEIDEDLFNIEPTGEMIMIYDEAQADESESTSYIMEWSETYKEAMSLIYTNDENKDIEKAIDHLEYEAERGNVLAFNELGKIYQKGIGIEIDEEKANQYYLNAFVGFQELYGCAYKMKEYIAYRIGKCFLYGMGTEQNYFSAIQHFKEASENKYALYSLGMMAKRGLGMEKNDSLSFHYFSQSADKGNAYAQYETAIAFESGKGVSKNLEIAENYYSLAYYNFIEMELENGDDNLQYRLGKMCYEGKGTEQDTKQAIGYLSKAVKLKNEHAKYLLAKIYLNENYFDHFEDAREMLEELAEKENESALFLLGKEYATGEHLEKDEEKAIQYLEKCSKKGNLFADYLLFQIYRNQEVPSIEKMIFYLKQSADRGNEIAQFQLGKMYLEGKYIQKNIESALKYLKYSAEQNNQFAQYVLGKLFLFGKEVEKDEELAIQYLEKAASQGNEYANWLLEHKDDAFKQPMTLLVSRFFHHLSRIFEKQLLPTSHNPLTGVDHKLRIKLQKKREALGHKSNDYTMNQER